MILAGDIGGTNTRLAIFDEHGQMAGKSQKFPTGNGKNLEAHITQVLKKHRGPTLTRACLAVAGPVIDGICESTNIGRTFVERDIRNTVGLDSLILINDLVANASGVELLKKNEIATILKGETHSGNCAVISPGTGLGEGALVWDGRHHRPIPSEGGHSRFAPTNDLEQDLLDYLMSELGTVTYEDVCSGKGIVPLFNFFVERGEAVPTTFRKKFDKADPAKRGAMISEAALTKQVPAAIAAMNLFVRVLGVEAANMAFKVFATGGVYIGGGIPPKILPLLKTATFKDAFLKHRTLGDLLKRIPVRVILNDDTALEGAALYGMRFER